MRKQFRSLCAGISDRMANAGGAYNFGNVLDLYAIAASALVAHPSASVSSVFTTLQSQFIGDRASLLMSTAALVFFAGGEAYHRAWARGFPPKKWVNFSGDILSGIGAILLGAGLYGLGEPALAMTSGGLHAVSKFGSALGTFKKMNKLLSHDFKLAGIVTTGMDMTKDLALLSRAPAFAFCAADVTGKFETGFTSQAVSQAIMPVILAWCYVEWARGDCMLLGKNSVLKQIGVSLSKRFDTFVTALDLPSPISERPFHRKPISEDPETIRKIRRADIAHLMCVGGIYGVPILLPFVPPLRGARSRSLCPSS